MQMAVAWAASDGGAENAGVENAGVEKAGVDLLPHFPVIFCSNRVRLL